MIDILNLAVPYFGLIFIGYACGKTKGRPEQGLAWMNFFLLYVSLPALLFGITAKTPFEELNNPPFLIATTCGTALAFFLAMGAGRLVGGISFRDATLAGLSGGYGNIGYMGPGLALAACARSIGQANRSQSADHVGLRRGAGRGVSFSSARRNRQYTVIFAKRRSADGSVRAGGDGRTAPVRPGTLGSAGGGRGEASD